MTDNVILMSTAMYKVTSILRHLKNAKYERLERERTLNAMTLAHGSLAPTEHFFFFFSINSVSRFAAVPRAATFESTALSKRLCSPADNRAF